MITRRKRWLVVPVLMGLLTIGITAGVALAQGGGERQSARDNFSNRVAAILGLDETIVGEAFAQAAQEAKEDRLAAREAHIQENLDQQVEDGVITQEQADQYMDWFKSRPEGVRPHLKFRGFWGHEGLDGRGFIGDVPEDFNFKDFHFGGFNFEGPGFTAKPFGESPLARGLFGFRIFDHE